MNRLLLAINLQVAELKVLIPFIAIFLVSLASCENDLEVVQAFNDPLKIPEVSSEKFETFYYDSARLTAKISSPLVMNYSQLKEPYTEFPQGIHVQLFDSLKKVKAEVKSKYAIFYDKQKLWEARKDVIVISMDGKQLNTEQLFWDQNKKIIYSDKFCRVTTPNASLTGNKFTAKEDFSSYELSEVQGPLKVKDE